jgi:N-acylneuraminate cytidylyltransferase
LNLNSIAVIPARSGSKRIPNKNVKPFLGEPIIRYSIRSAIESELFDKVVVSTDSEIIADLAIKYGASVPFFRSEKNSGDYATTADVLLEVISEFERNNLFFKTLCCLYPTAPFVTSSRLINAMKILESNNEKFNGVVPITEFSYPILRSLVIKNENLKMKWPENYNMRSQDFEKFYHDAGQFYLLDVATFKIEKKLYLSNSAPMVLSNLEVQDIDNLDDWEIAEMKYKLLIENYFNAK